MKDFRHLSEEYTEIGHRLIDTRPELEHIKASECQIAFLGSPIKKKGGCGIVKGQCEKVADRWKWSVPFDFAITIFEPNCEGMTEKQMEVLIFHELLHVGIEYSQSGEVYSIIPHDLEDFKLIIREYGVDWSEVNNVNR